MKLNRPAAVLIGVLAAAPAFAAEQSVNLYVPGMDCPSCPFIVEYAISGVDGVISVVANSVQRTALVVFDDAAVTIDQIIEATTNAGYEAVIDEVQG